MGYQITQGHRESLSQATIKSHIPQIIILVLALKLTFARNLSRDLALNVINIDTIPEQLNSSIVWMESPQMFV